MKDIIIPFIICTVTATLTTLLISYLYYKKELRQEFLRGMETGVEYYKKHNEYPSYYQWNAKFENPDYNMDSVAFIHQSITLPETSVQIEYDTADASLIGPTRVKVKDSDSTYHYIYY